MFSNLVLLTVLTLWPGGIYKPGIPELKTETENPGCFAVVEPGEVPDFPGWCGENNIWVVRGIYGQG